jgi:transcriptional regulator with XRE-family HTH domain
MTRAPSPIGAELRWMRAAAGKTCKQMAIILDVAEGTASRWETGNRRISAEALETWRRRCEAIVRRRASSPYEKDRAALYLQRIENPAYARRLTRLRLAEALVAPLVLVPMDPDRLVVALTEAWQARTEQEIDCSPEEHCAALADAVIKTAIEC